jgi:hypothetical protein
MMGYGIAVDGSGNVYVTGETEGGLDGNPSAGGYDIFVVKYDSAGVKQWVRQLGTGGWDVGIGIAVDGSGNVYVTGWTQGGLDGNPSAGGYDIFVVKYDSAGVKQWVRQLGTGGWDVGYGIAVDGSGNVYVTGETDGGLDGNPSAGGRDVFILSLRSSQANQPPSVTLTSPVTGSSYTAPANITFAATATDSDGSIARVEFWTGATLLNSDTSSPYSYSWTGVAAGSYALRASVDGDRHRPGRQHCPCPVLPGEHAACHGHCKSL